MANYTATAVSNYFAVKDADAFTATCERLGLEYSSTTKDDRTLYRVSGPNDDCGAFPRWLPSDDPDEDDITVDFVREIAAHLADGWVAVFMEAGAEGSRSVTGVAWACNNTGSVVTIDLDDIYGHALMLGDHCTKALPIIVDARET